MRNKVEGRSFRVQQKPSATPGLEGGGSEQMCEDPPTLLEPARLWFADRVVESGHRVWFAPGNRLEIEPGTGWRTRFDASPGYKNTARLLTEGGQCAIIASAKDRLPPLGHGLGLSKRRGFVYCSTGEDGGQMGGVAALARVGPSPRPGTRRPRGEGWELWGTGIVWK